MRKVVLILPCLISLLLGAAAQENPTLADVLKQYSIAFSPTSVRHLNSKITGYGILDDDGEFVIGYYLDNPKNEMLRAPLLVTRFDKISERWSYVAFSESQLRVSDIKGGPDISCLGSVLRVQRGTDWYYLTLHWNPSAGCLVVLKPDLTLSDARTGGISNTFGSGLAVVDGNMVHFADVHPQTLYLYEPKNRQVTPLFPQEHDPFRADFSRRLTNIINDDLCRESNWGCDVNRFSTDLSYPIETNEETQAVAFRATFDPEGFVPRETSEKSAAWNDDDYAYIFQLQPFHWREFSVYDLRPKFGTDSLEELISPAMIQRVFATPEPQ